jgi:hypothetical protein
MYTKDVNARSPLRVFEKSIHGGLGKGNLGVVMSRAGVGKTAFLIGVALDDLMRGRNVLHISDGDSVDHVRDFYEDIFQEIRRSTPIQDAALTSYLVERHRIIHTYRGVDMNVARIQRDTAFYRDHAGFAPEVVVVDGFDFRKAAETDLAALRDFARSLNVELWLSALTHRDEPVTDPHGVPNPVARFDSWLSVMVVLEPIEGAIRIRLLKDHDNPDVEQLHMKLDPRTLLLAESA